MTIPQRKGEPIVVDRGRGHPRRHHRRVARPSCARRSRKDGTITAGSASQISDGAAAVVVMSKAKAEELGLSWIAEIGAHGVVAGPDSTLQSQPARRDREGACERRASTRRTSTWSRSTRRSRPSASRPTRELGIDAGEGQRQRRRDRDRAPARHVRCPDRAAPGARAAATRRRHRRGGAVRRRRTGRRADRPGPEEVVHTPRRHPVVETVTSLNYGVS